MPMRCTLAIRLAIAAGFLVLSVGGAFCEAEPIYARCVPRAGPETGAGGDFERLGLS